MKIPFAVFTIALICGHLLSAAQENCVPYVMPNTEVRLLTSQANHVSYKLYISYPKSYRNSPEKEYPVLYLLDADYSFAIVRNIVEHLSDRNHLEEIIIVGIAYDGPDQYRLNRTRDYTPTHVLQPVGYGEEYQRHSGGGPGFLHFIEKELIPYFDNNFRTNEFRVLSGHSYGGLFSSWVFLKNTGLFSGFIIVSPSLWYDDHLILKLTDNLKHYSGSAVRVYLTVGDREINGTWNMPRDLKDFHARLSAIQNSHISVKLDIGVNETHNSIFPTGVSNGIRYVFGGQ